ncbi:MAG TPA: MoaD/ThiS family protein [Candidatus Limnocylindrales bacterium]|nr:MoaD/ThiS family protein [Candidatus Limnocylindrales bacterium]
MTRVRIPPVLRIHLDGQKEAEATGGTVGELLRDLVSRHPGLGEQLFTENGEMHRFVNVYVNGQDVRYLGVLETPVSDRDQVIILPAMAGGAGAGDVSGEA